MSLILDALNRSDTERANPDAAPGLQSVHGAFPEPSVPLWRRALWPGLVLVLAIVAVLPWLGDGDPAPEPRRMAEAVEPTATGGRRGEPCKGGRRGRRDKKSACSRVDAGASATPAGGERRCDCALSIPSVPAIPAIPTIRPIHVGPGFRFAGYTAICNPV